MKADLDTNIIFIGGVHGVGKTTLCKKISQKFLLKHYSASQLISNIKSDSKIVENILDNQNSLLESVNKYLNKKEYYLIDGHFCLLTGYQTVTKVPLATFKSLRINSIIVLVDDEQEILKRLEYRDTKIYSLNLIKKFQNKEISYAKDVARDLNAKINIININDIDEMIIFIDNIISQ